MLGTGETYLFPGPLLAGDLAILGATGVTALVWYLIFEVLRMGGPLFLSQFGYIIVLTGPGWGALIFGERLSQLRMDRGRIIDSGPRGAHVFKTTQPRLAGEERGA